MEKPTSFMCELNTAELILKWVHKSQAPTLAFLIKYSFQ